MDPMWLAMSKLRRGRTEECIQLCDNVLSNHPSDQCAWIVKCRAVIKQSYIDDVELDEEGVAEMLMDENAVASIPRPGTSLNASRGNSSDSGSMDQSVRPVSQSGRPLTGFSRPGSSRPMSSTTDVRSALQSGRRTGTARPMTNLGREVRLGTASLQASGNLVDSSRINVKKYAGRTGIAMAITDYLIYVEHNIRKALELCSEATKAHDFKDWWWKARLGKCYFKLGLFREAERQFRSSIKAQPTVSTYLELCNVYIRMDLPNTALDLLTEASEKFTAEPRILLGIARLYDMLHDSNTSLVYYKKVLSLEASNIESIACLGAHFFYSDQPEVSIRYYRRLLQMGVNNTELWNNLGLCCFYASQYDMALNCFERALSMASDDNMADVWYNIGHVGVALGDLGLAYQAFKVSVSVDPTHGEALNNIAVLEMRRQKVDVARSCLSAAVSVNSFIFEPLYNNALLLYRLGDFQESYSSVCKALEVYPKHDDSLELKDTLQKLFSSS